MKFVVSACFLVLISSLAISEEIEGVFEQEPYMDFDEIKDDERRNRIIDSHEKNKQTIVLQKGRVRIHMQEELVLDQPYEKHGRTIVAQDDGLFIVLYLQDNDTLQSSFVTYKRICCD